MTNQPIPLTVLKKFKKRSITHPVWLSQVLLQNAAFLATVSSLIDAGKYVYYITDAIAGLDNEKEEATIKVLEGLTPLHLSIMTTNEFKALAQSNTSLSKLNLF